jgi:membrane protein implicated in regulation of membrane protease activity
MLKLKEWMRIRKKKEKKNEQRSSQTYGESGYVNQQGEVARGNPQVAQQTVHVFAVPEL